MSDPPEAGTYGTVYRTVLSDESTQLVLQNKPWKFFYVPLWAALVGGIFLALAKPISGLDFILFIAIAVIVIDTFLIPILILVGFVLVLNGPNKYIIDKDGIRFFRARKQVSFYPWNAITQIGLTESRREIRLMVDSVVMEVGYYYDEAEYEYIISKNYLKDAIETLEQIRAINAISDSPLKS